jgi:putative phosphoribosyl transferase
MNPRFRDRRHAGQVLAQKLAPYAPYANRNNLLVLALPRGGVPVAFEVARSLRAPLDVFLVRKLGVPGQEELAMGAIAPGGTQLLNQEVIDGLGVTHSALEAVIRKEQLELERREKLYRGESHLLSLMDRVVVLVDDGLATGSTMRAAVAALRQHHPGRIVVAVPIAPPATCAELNEVADDVVCAMTPEPFHSVGLWYEDFAQTTDDEVRELLDLARRERGEEGRVAAHA